jgi:mono/diheme cytochrome c family protein
MMYASDAEAVREWIRDGVSRARADSRAWQAERDSGALVMPAFGDRLSPSAIDDLVAFVMATGATPVPEDSLARHGMDRARALGCFGCHGPGGRFAPPNPGAFKGVIPSWNGGDFPDVVRGRDEFAQWVRHGVSDRFRGNPFARFFLERAAIRMPAYERFLEPGDVDALWAYVTWLRSGGESGER